MVTCSRELSNEMSSSVDSMWHLPACPLYSTLKGKIGGYTWCSKGPCMKQYK